MADSRELLDVIIVGGGPAGLSAALILGRCLRRVLVCDGGQPRNAASEALHGYLTRDGIPPLEFLKIGREQLRQYETVELRHIAVTEAARTGDRFQVMLADGTRLSSRKLLLATGVVDNVPDIEGVGPLYGRSVWHCPYCDGWEVRGQPLAIYGRGENGKGLALELTAWSRDLVLCTDGPSELEASDIERLSRNGIQLREERILKLEGKNGQLEHLVFANGERLARRGMFFSTGSRQGCDLPAHLGCEFTEKGAVNTGEYESTQIPGLYVAGDASRAVQLVIVAAAEGAQAAFAINTALLKEDLE
ncbi:MAG TPA: NAD(P)/FAD-dependent oxidoreductase [Blastocatellia bacterium]|nr:NAD(P)/FAD-dependent oxidoreductase [Blastocatellia bacterium]